jgi:glycosyltransferase involved in cell wall biosynthesis
LKPLYKWVEQRYLLSVDGFIYNSKTTRNIVQQTIGMSKPHVVAYPAADHLKPPPRTQVMTAIARRTEMSRPLRLLFIGNIIPRKGLHTILDALAGVASPSVHLNIVGSQEVDPDYSAAMQRRACEQGLSPKITWHGRVTDERLTHLLCESDSLVMPSYEGFGIVYLEAMSFGLPVLASRTGAAPELIHDGINGYLLRHQDSSQFSHYIDLLDKNRMHLATLSYFARQRYDEHPTWWRSMNVAFNWLHETNAHFR